MMGISLTEIKKCLCGESTLEEVLNNRIAEAGEEENYLKGTKALCELFLIEETRMEDLPDTDQELLMENLSVYERVLEEVKRKDRTRKKIIKIKEAAGYLMLLLAGIVLGAYGLQTVLEASAVPVVAFILLLVLSALIARSVYVSLKY